MMIINICSLSCYELTLCSLSCCSSLVMSSCARWRLPDFVFNSAVLVSKSFLACFNSFSIFSFFLASRCASLLRTWMSSLSWSSKSKEKIKTTIQGFWYFARSRTREIQVFPRNTAKFPKKREIPRNPPEIFPNTCRQNVFNTYLGY